MDLKNEIKWASLMLIYKNSLGISWFSLTFSKRISIIISVLLNLEEDY